MGDFDVGDFVMWDITLGDFGIGEFDFKDFDLTPIQNSLNNSGDKDVFTKKLENIL